MTFLSKSCRVLGVAGVLREVKYDWVFGTDYTGELLTSHSTQPDEDPCETTLDAPVDGREAQVCVRGRRV